jgi:hypothetical protein
VNDPSLPPAISSAFRDLYDFGREQGEVPGVVAFWRETFAQERRLLTCGPVGSRVEAVLAALTGARVDEARLHRRICEVRPDPAGGSEPDGIDVLPGDLFAGALVSAAVHGTAAMDPDALPLADWLDRVALVSVVSPAPAVLGKLEIELMERLTREGRGFCVVITRLEGSDEEHAEIEEHKVEPLREELGGFEVFYVAEEGGPALRDSLAAWVLPRLDSEHLSQLHRVVARWTAELKSGLEARAAGERKIAARLDFLAGHLEDQVGRLRDLVTQERTAMDNRVLEAVRALEKARDEAVLTGRPAGMGTAREELAARQVSAPGELVRRVRERFAGQIREFCEAYRDLLPPFDFDPGEAFTGEPADRRLDEEAETVLRGLERHVLLHVQTRRASLQAAASLARLEELATEWDRAVTRGRG